MTLKKEFQNIEDEGKTWSQIYDLQVKIADEYAIEFAEWMLIKFITSLETGIDAESDDPKELLEIFKKDKGL